MRKLAILLLICAWCREAGAQAPMNKDSLLHLLPAAREDTSKVWLLIDIGNQYEWDDPETAAKYYLEAGELSEKLEYKQGTIKFIANYSYLLNLRGQLDSSMLLNRQSVKLAEELGDKFQIRSMLIWAMFSQPQSYDSVVYYYQTARKF